MTEWITCHRSSAAHAPLEIGFDYTRSLGPVLGQFMTGLRDRRILGARGADGRVHVPPFEYDPVTHAPPRELVEVGPAGTVISWSWMPTPLDGPAAGPAVRVGADPARRRGHRAAARGRRRRRPPRCGPGCGSGRGGRPSGSGSIRDIECFEPSDAPPDALWPPRSRDGRGAGHHDRSRRSGCATSTPPRPGRAATCAGWPRAGCSGSAAPPAARSTCRRGGLPGRRRARRQTRSSCPTSGTVTTFCVVNVPFPGQQVTPPYVAAAVLLDGADIPFQHLILGCAGRRGADGHAGARRSGGRASEWGTTPENIDHFEPDRRAGRALRVLCEVHL